VDRTRKRTVAIGAVAALAVAGGGVAYAAANGGDHRDALLRDAAQRLNVSPDELRSALEGAFDDQLDQAVKDGQLTQQQADRMKQAIREHGLPLGGPGPIGPGGPMGHVVFAGPPGLDAAADYLRLSRADLLRSLSSGKTLADVAGDRGKSVDGLEQALVDEAQARLDRAVADGKLSSDQRDELLQDIREHVDDLVNGRLPQPPRFHREWRGGPDGPGGLGMRGGPPPLGLFPDRP
jgi:polyhydroxyalkanoate synthesis regulator phasin